MKTLLIIGLLFSTPIYAYCDSAEDCQRQTQEEIGYLGAKQREMEYNTAVDQAHREQRQELDRWYKIR